MNYSEAIELVRKALDSLCVRECGEVEDNCRHQEAFVTIHRGASK
jgi:hypothetical protein